MRRVWIAISVVVVVGAACLAGELRVPEDYATIQAAVDAASPGDTIRIGPGVYTERLSIDKDLALVGAGMSETVIALPERSEGHMISGASADAQDLGFTSTAVSPWSGGIVVQTGALSIERCFIHLQGSLHGVQVTGTGSLRATACSFQDTYLAISGGARTEIASSAFGMCKLSLLDDSYAGLTSCSVQSGSLSAFGSATLVLEDCLLSAGNDLILLDRVAVSLRGDAKGLIRRCTVRDSDTGVELRYGAQAELTACRIEGNRTGVELRYGAQAELTACLIEGNRVFGVAAWDTAHAMGSENVVTGNGCELVGNVGAGFRVVSGRAVLGGRPAFITLPDPKYASVQEAVDALHDVPGGGTVQLRSGEYSGAVTIDATIRICSLGEDTAVIRALRTDTPVLSCVGGSRLVLDGVSVTGGEGGLVVGENASARLTRDSIANCRGPAIQAFSAAEVFISGTRFEYNMGDLRADGKSTVRLESCKLIKSHGAAVEMGGSSTGILSRTLIDTWGRGIVAYGSAKVSLSDVTIGTSGSGVELRDQASLDMERSCVNPYYGSDGVVIRGDGVARVTGCVVTNAGRAAHLEDRATFEATGCLFDANGTGLSVGGDAKANVIWSLFFESSGSAVVVEGGQSRLSDCSIARSGRCGIEVWRGSASVERSSIAENAMWGVFSLAPGAIAVRGSSVHANALGDVFIREGSAYLDPRLPVEARIDDLMARMSLEEKAAQLDIVSWDVVRDGGLSHLDGIGIGSVLARLFGSTPSLAAETLDGVQRNNLARTYLGIPILVGSDCPLGASVDEGTIFPCGIAMAGTWDPGLIQTVGAVIAQESRAVGIHQNYGPVLDICRDPRWGRVEESPGEDPFLASSFGRAMVEGLQSGARGESTEMIATPKHFAAYARIIGGRNGTSTSVSERELREIYLPPFEAAIAEAGANSIMTAYSELNGTPCVASPWLLRTVLRDEWGFEGFVTTDWECVEDLVREFSVAASDEEAAALAMNAGADLHMLDTSGGRLYESYLISAVRSGKIEISVVDEAVRRVLRQKFELGLFENPFSDADAARQTVGASENEEVALRVAQESLVLLKNDRGVLPLSDSQRVVLVPLNDDGQAMLGWGYDWSYNVSSVEDSAQLAWDEEALSIVSRWDLEWPGSEAGMTAWAAVDQADVIVMVGGEPGDWTGESWDGNPRDRATLEFPDDQQELIAELSKRGKPVVLVVLSGRPLVFWDDMLSELSAVLWAWKPGTMGGPAIVDALLGRVDPSGRLPISFPRSEGQIPVYYNHSPSTRETEYANPFVEQSPLFSFGYGLSYAEFRYRSLQVVPTASPQEDGVNILVDVENVSDRSGVEVVQVYLRDRVSSVVTPVRKLAAFTRLSLGPREKQTATLHLDAKSFCVLNQQLVWVVEPGEFEIMVGSSSDDIKLSTTVDLPSAP